MDSERPDREIVEKIDRNDLEPITDNNHEHIYINDSTDETEDYRAMKCIYCPQGILVRKN